MNSIHRKSAIDKTAAIILGAHEHEEKLIWDRYEQQVPLCAFTANSLNCRRCFHGPCRINPFGDEPSRGICGADRGQIVMENLFQTTLQGVLETARILPTLGGPGSSRDFSGVADDLPEATRKEYAAGGLIPVHKDQLYEVQNSYFSHQDYLGRTLKDLMRLGLIHFGFLKQVAELSGQSFLERSSFNAAGANVLIVGQPSSALLVELRSKADRYHGGTGLNLWIQGSKAIAIGLPLADHGHPELALGMNTDALVIAPDAAAPGLVERAAKLDIPVFLVDDTRPVNELGSVVVDAAFRHQRKTSDRKPLPLAPPHPQGENLLNQGGRVREALEAGRIRGVLVILGEPNVKNAFFETTLALLEKLIPQQVLVLVGGELGAHTDLLLEELGRHPNIMLPDGVAEGYRQGLPPYARFELSEIPRVVGFMRELGQGRRFGGIPAVVSFPEFSRASTWATAVTFLSLGFAVQIGSPLPFWGSPDLSEVLLKEWPKISGGALLTSPGPSTGPRLAQEILSFLETHRAKQV
jgi:hypothetical protein